jgi:excisionase family DNA binding protein
MSTSAIRTESTPAKSLATELDGTSPGSLQRSDPRRLLTINEVAEWLGVSRAWVYDHVTRKKPFLPCVRLGEITRFRAAEIERFIQDHARGNGSS